MVVVLRKLAGACRLYLCGGCLLCSEVCISVWMSSYCNIQISWYLLVTQLLWCSDIFIPAGDPVIMVFRYLYTCRWPSYYGVQISWYLSGDPVTMVFRYLVTLLLWYSDILISVWWPSYMVFRYLDACLVTQLLWCSDILVPVWWPSYYDVQISWYLSGGPVTVVFRYLDTCLVTQLLWCSDILIPVWWQVIGVIRFAGYNFLMESAAGRVQYWSVNVLSELPTLLTAAVGTACSLLGSLRNGQAALYLFKKHWLVGSTFIASVSADVFETDIKHLIVHLQCFLLTTCLLTSARDLITSILFTGRHVFVLPVRELENAWSHQFNGEQ
jgi:hypothetical protein